MGNKTKKNCWEFKCCEREPGGRLAEELGVCPASTDEKFDGIHEGNCGGRMCWLVAGTFCTNNITGSFAIKLGNCMFCDFYKLVKLEEGPAFQRLNQGNKVVP